MSIGQLGSVLASGQGNCVFFPLMRLVFFQYARKGNHRWRVPNKLAWLPNQWANFSQRREEDRDHGVQARARHRVLFAGAT